MGKHGRKLTAAFVRSVREPGLYWDEHGLVLRVKPSGYKQWIQRLFIHGKRRELGLGPFRLVTLAEARDAALANRKVARAGGDPRTKRRSTVPTFEQAAAKVFAMHRANWTDRHAGQWIATLRTYAYPGIGGKRVDRIRSADVMGVLMPIWNDKYQTAKRVRQRISTVMRWAIAQGYRVDNPAGDAIGAALPKPPRIQKHYKALPTDQVAGAVATVRRSDARLSVKLGIEFPGAHGRPVGRGAGSAVGGDRHPRRGVDDSGGADEEPPGAPGAAVGACGRGLGGGQGARAPLGVGVSVGEGAHADEHGLQRPAEDARDRGRAARVPFELPGLGGGAHRRAPRGHGGRARARGPGQSGGSVCPLRPLRAPPRPHGAVGRVSFRAGSGQRSLMRPFGPIHPPRRAQSPFPAIRGAFRGIYGP